MGRFNEILRTQQVREADNAVAPVATQEYYPDMNYNFIPENNRGIAPVRPELAGDHGSDA